MSDRTCEFPDCDKRARSRGLCASHADQQRKGQELRPLRPYPVRRFVAPGEACAAPGCRRDSRLRGYCDTHYAASLRGLTLAPLDQSDEEWFFSRVTEGPGGCWIWQGDRGKAGYGRLRDRTGNRLFTLAHRWSYEFLRSEIPAGLTIDHLCRVHPCVNPWHLEPVSAAVNTLRGEAPSAQNARKTHCIRGHEFTPENTISRPEGGRRCRQCMNAYNAKIAARRRADKQGLAN